MGGGSRHLFLKSPCHVSWSVCCAEDQLSVCVCVFGLPCDGLAMRCSLVSANANVIRVIISGTLARRHGYVCHNTGCVCLEAEERAGNPRP